jgi:hypothetical protein
MIRLADRIPRMTGSERADRAPDGAMLTWVVYRGALVTSTISVVRTFVRPPGRRVSSSTWAHHEHHAVALYGAVLRRHHRAHHQAAAIIDRGMARVQLCVGVGRRRLGVVRASLATEGAPSSSQESAVGWGLVRLYHVSLMVPSTMMCSADRSVSAWSISRRNQGARDSQIEKAARPFVKTVGAYASSSISRPKNHLTRVLSSSAARRPPSDGSPAAGGPDGTR